MEHRKIPCAHRECNTNGSCSSPDTYLPNHNSTGDQATSHPPTGPPLLDRNETGFLSDFFDNPANIEPDFLALTQARHEHDPYSAATQPWMFGGMHQEHAPHTQQHSSSEQSFGPQAGTSDEVYNAAKLLSSGQPYSRASYGHAGYVDNPQAAQNQIYPYHQPHVPQSGVYSPESGQTSSSTPSVYGTMMPNQTIGGRRPAPLNFGSDNEFRATKYAAPNVAKPPDQDLMSILSTFSQDPGESPLQTNLATPSTHRRKRRRSSEAASIAEASDEQTSGRYKRGKTKARTRSDLEVDDNTPSGQQSGRAGKLPKVSSPGQRRRSSPSGRRPTRENLTEEQKRSNHIQSEQKRRNLIKHGYDETTKMVPELRPGGFSRSAVLQEAAKFMRELKEGNDRLSSIVGLLDKG